MIRLLSLALLLGVLGTVATVPAAPSSADQVKVKEALRELQDFIGGWKGTSATKLRPGPRDPIWNETVQWNWRFKGDSCWLSVDFSSGKFLKSAEIHYDLDKKTYQLIGTPPGGGDKQVFTGKLNDEKLIFERSDPKTKEVQRIRMNTAADGLRFIYLVDRRTATGTIWKLEFMAETTKIGESLASKEKKPECVVSGGLGTMTVSYNGEVFYVCCSGCAEAFRENPKKYVDEFKARKGKK